MAKLTEKDKIIDFLVKNAIDEIEFIDVMEFEDACEQDAIDDILDELVEGIIAVAPHRRGVSHKVPKSLKSPLNILSQLDEKKFFRMLRVNRIEFTKLVSLISDDREFNQSHSCEQFSVEYQLAIVLCRLGSSGKRTSVRKIAEFFGVGNGGTIDKITRRIFKAFLNLQSKYISWPNAEERGEIVSDTYNELPFCIGYIDAFEIPLTETPSINEISFFSRTHKYSIKAQLICDYKLRIRHSVVGYPGSVRDYKIFRKCDIHKQPKKYFSHRQWIAADFAYSLSPTVITPYSTTPNQMDSKKRKLFNRRHSSYRVRIEHCCKMLKANFNSLKDLKMRINSPQSHILCCQWIVVCCILHNILLDGRRVNTEEELIENGDTDEEANEEQDVCPQNEKYEYKRQTICSLLFD